MVFENITKSIGNTPLIDASVLTGKSKVRLFLKLEGHIIQAEVSKTELLLI